MILHIAIATLLAGNGLNAIVYREDQVACSPGWVEVTQHELQGSKTCIKLQHVKQCWADARTACQRDGGDLVKILTRTMNDEIMYQVSLYEGESFWFGLRGKMNAQYTWHWLDEYEEVEQSWFQFPWSRHQLRICGEISRQTGERGSWRYRICSEPKKFICQRLPINQITPGPGNSFLKPSCHLALGPRNSFLKPSCHLAPGPGNSFLKPSYHLAPGRGTLS
ncbi:hypothetical protein RRG08_063868 [Elysia crispata]|uniref:C-type lectin domain-containing protein n=1 Tax=Elysia crispata TaxID=231223 RepID=A0AAE1DW33_9GAST|nr:hypothetical protein RRG08_063868 [Elysia crispata]